MIPSTDSHLRRFVAHRIAAAEIEERANRTFYTYDKPIPASRFRMIDVLDGAMP